jgi:hypothetical protein
MSCRVALGAIVLRYSPLHAMGWSYNTRKQSKESFVHEIIMGFSNNALVLAHSVRGNNLWVLVKPSDADPIICLFLMSSDKGCWGYKSMDESMGPYYYNCPLTFLDRSPEPHGCNINHMDSGRTWRDYVRDHYKELSNRDKPKVGDTVKLDPEKYPGYQQSYRVTDNLGRKGLLLDGYLRLKCYQIRHAKVISTV